jgi:hypothetical protein
MLDLGMQVYEFIEFIDLRVPPWCLSCQDVIFFMIIILFSLQAERPQS